MSRLQGKAALISGAARGIGEAIARAFVAEGARVFISDIDDTTGIGIGDEHRRGPVGGFGGDAGVAKGNQSRWKISARWGVLIRPLTWRRSPTDPSRCRRLM